MAGLRKAASGSPSLIVVMGRRRVGKSALINAALEGSGIVAFQADQQPERTQLDLLAREASRILPGSPPIAFATWDAAFDFFEDQAARARLTVVLDEFQFLVSAQPALASILQRRWDDWQRRGLPLVIVICGSALGFMHGLLDERAPLYGRAGFRCLVLPLDFREAAGFAPEGMTARHLIERFGLLGGTPQYQIWGGPAQTRSILQSAMLARGSPLYEEPLNLVRSEEGLRDPASYFGALYAIGRGETRTGQIASRLGLDASITSRMLDRLSKLAYIEQISPVDLGSKPSRPIWKITDPYFRFWFANVFPNRSRLERDQTRDVLVDVMSGFDAFMGTVFEECCRVWAGRYWGAAGQSLRVGSWWSRTSDAEIDVVAAGKNGYTVLGSCKWSANDLGEAVLDKLYESRALLGPRAARATLILFARSGFTQSLQRRAVRESVTLVTADDLFSP